MAFVWSFFLVTMLNYVAGSIAGIPTFDFMAGIVASVALGVMIIVISAIIPDGEVADL